VPCFADIEIYVLNQNINWLRGLATALICSYGHCSERPLLWIGNPEDTGVRFGTAVERQSLSALPRFSDVDLLGNGERIVYLDP
jgi:hypothetical protein